MTLSEHRNRGEQQTRGHRIAADLTSYQAQSEIIRFLGCAVGVCKGGLPETLAGVLMDEPSERLACGGQCDDSRQVFLSN